MKHLLIIRFSALGDVAMAVPVVASLARQYPQMRITVLSRGFMRPLFCWLPQNVRFIGVDLKNEYQGVRGMEKLYRRLKTEEFTAVADFHDVLRSKYLRMRYRLSGIPVAHIRKDREGRQQLVRQRHKVIRQQLTSFEKYAAVLARLGYPVTVDFTTLFPSGKPALEQLELPLCGAKGNNRWIGIAPFAAHKGKIYPLDQMEQVIAALSACPQIRIFLFGAGATEKFQLETWCRTYPNTFNMAGRLPSMAEELMLMSHLDAMLSMDSANMHLASLVAVPVVSIWGATHPLAGFAGWKQDPGNMLQTDLPCRPCSVYGNRPCLRRDYACLTTLSPRRIVDKLLQVTGLTPTVAS